MANLKNNTATIQNILNTINALPEAGENLDTSNATAQAQHILAPYTAYAKGILMTGTLETEELSVAPTSEVQTFVPNGKLYSKVTIDAVDPSLFGSVVDSSVAASAGDIVASKQAWVNGTKLTGTMVDRGTVNQTLNTSTTSYTIPAGKHSGSGRVSITTQAKSATPSTSSQTITPDSGKVLSSVTVGAIPSTYVQPSATQAGGTYTLDPGESISRAAGTYLTSALNVTAAAASGSGRITSTWLENIVQSYTTSNGNQIQIRTGNCTNLIGAAAIYAGTTASDNQITSIVLSCCGSVKEGAVLFANGNTDYMVDTGVDDLGIFGYITIPHNIPNGLWFVWYIYSA